jgi:hypothetical protein
LNARKDETVDQNDEALAARDGADHVLRLPWLGIQLKAVGMAGAIGVTKVVRPRGRSGQHTRRHE